MPTKLGTISRKKHDFHDFPKVGPTMPDLGRVQTFHSAYGSSWGFACAKLWPQWQAEKYSWRKRIGSFMRNPRFSTAKVHIVYGRLATQHARCHKEYYSPRGQAVSTSHFWSRVCLPFCVSKAILHFWRPKTAQKSQFLMIFQHVRLATGAPMQTLSLLKLFPYPMDWAEVLHEPSYDISGRRKNTPGQNELVLSCEIFDFPKFPPT